MQTNLLCALLLFKHFLLLGNNFALVLQTEGKRERNEQRRSGDDPDNVSNELAALFYERGGLRDA